MTLLSCELRELHEAPNIPAADNHHQKAGDPISSTKTDPISDLKAYISSSRSPEYLYTRKLKFFFTVYLESR